MMGVGRSALGVATWTLLLTGVASVVWSASVPIGQTLATDPAHHRPPLLVAARPYTADSLARATVTRPLFRAGRRPAGVPYDPARGTQAVVPEARPPKPLLLLVGVLLGSEPTAVIEGFPGVEGARVVRPGDLVAGLRIQRITDHGVRIAGMDTVWVLQVREPWK